MNILPAENNNIGAFLRFFPTFQPKYLSSFLENRHINIETIQQRG